MTIESKIRMLAFDKLPQAVRDALNDSIYDFPPVQVLNYFTKHGEHATLSYIRNLETAARLDSIVQSAPVFDV
jgi:hypothetical protein